MTAMIYCTKFVVRVREEDFETTLSILKASVLPSLSRRGFFHPLVVAKRRPMERVNRERARGAVEALASMMVREARRHEPEDPSLGGDINLLCHIVLVGPRSSTEGMLAHHKMRKRPTEYERLRDERDSARNRDVVNGVQLDVYARHSREVTRVPDPARNPNLPLAMISLRYALKEQLFLGVTAVNCLVLTNSDVGVGTRREPSHALQTYVAVPGGRRSDEPGDVRARLHALLNGASENHGAGGILALKSLGTGVTRDLRWLLRGIPQHRGDETDVSGSIGILSGDIYEAVLCFGNKGERNEALERIDVGLLGVVGREFLDEGLGAYASRAVEVVIV